MRRRPLWLAGLLALMALGTAAQDPETPPRTRSLGGVPERPEDAMTGTAFARSTAGMTGRERQRAAVREILRGNVPSFVRLLRPVLLSTTLDDGRKLRGTVWVSPDYVAIGSDDDFLRMPLTWPSATAVATAFDCLLPTPRIVDAVWSQADRHLEPFPLPPGPKMRSSEYYLRQRDLIEGKRGDVAPHVLVAGHKKDVVLSPRLSRKAGRIAIYGWHRPSGRPIQPLSTVHDARYADYSHGVRLVAPEMLLDGQPTSIYRVLTDPVLAPLLSVEGPIPEARTLMGAARQP